MRSSYGSIVYISMAVTFLAFMPLIVMLPQLRLISIVALVALMVSIGLYPFMIKYKFDDEKVSISNPLSWNEPPAYYDRIYKIIDTNKAYISNHHGTSPDSIQIWYDGGLGTTSAFPLTTRRRHWRYWKKSARMRDSKSPERNE